MTPPTKLNAAFIGVLVTLMLNFSALVWGAAKLSAAVEGLQATTERLGVAVERVMDKAVDLDRRVSVIEATRKEP